MPRHAHHQHKPQIFERDAAVETVVSVVYVTAKKEDAPDAAAAPTTRRENGAPIHNTRLAAEAVDATTSHNTQYSAPNRQMRPNTAATSSFVPYSIQTAIPSEATSAGVAALAASSAPLEISSSSLEVSSSAPATSKVSSKAALSSKADQSTTLVPSYVSKAITTGVAANTFDGDFTAATSSPSKDGTTVTKSSTDNGMSGGAKAGIAIAVIVGVAFLALLAFFLIRRKKEQSHEEHQRLDDEKTAMRNRSQSVSSHVSVGRSKTNAPRLSLRPVTQMFPIPGQQMSEKQGNGLAPDAGMRSRTPEPASQNPFGDEADDKSGLTPLSAAAAPTPVTARFDQVAQDSPRSASQAFPIATAGSRRNSPPGPGQNNVHRIQLDFKPSMDDELELRAGSLVRMLHEYDDGWALCIRLDRSQQGVVPRTCISKVPVKPRPGPPPGVRAGPPQGQAQAGQAQPRPRAGSNASHSSAASSPRQSPQYGRPIAPPNARIRAQSNAPRRPQSPAQYARGPSPQNGRARSNSDAMSTRRITPPSPMNSSPMSSTPSSPPQGAGMMPARKPVPGQAM